MKGEPLAPVIACIMLLRTLLAAMVIAVPAWAQPVAVPDCTVDVTVAKDLKLDVVYRCRAATALTFEPDDQEIAAQMSGYRGARLASAPAGPATAWAIVSAISSWTVQTFFEPSAWSNVCTHR